MSLPTISIVTPSLNQGQFIRTAIESVLNQGYADLEYWIIDGGSSDQSCEIAREFLPRLSLLSEKDEGQSDAINKGFSRVYGEIIGWLNADDRYAPNALATVAEVFVRHPDVMLVYGNAEYVDEAGSVLAPAQVEPFDLSRLLTVGNFIAQPSAFFRRRAFEAVGGLRKELNWTMDYDLWIRLGKKYKATHVPETLAQIRCYLGTKTSVGGQLRFAELDQMIKSHGGHGLPAYYSLEAAGVAAHEAIQEASRLRFSNAFRSAREALKHSLSARTIAALALPRTWRVIRSSRATRVQATGER